MKTIIFSLIISFIFSFIAQAQLIKAPLPRQTELTYKRVDDPAEVIYDYSSYLSEETLIAFYRKTLASLGFKEGAVGQDNLGYPKIFLFHKDKTKLKAELIMLGSLDGRNRYSLVITDEGKQKKINKSKGCPSCAK